MWENVDKGRNVFFIFLKSGLEFKVSRYACDNFRLHVFFPLSMKPAILKGFFV